MRRRSGAASAPSSIRIRLGALARAATLVTVAAAVASAPGCRQDGSADSGTRGGREASDGGEASLATSTPAAEAASSVASPMTASIVDPAANEGAGSPCRVMASEGGPGARADATAWLDVADKASFTVRTLESGRELRFEGPGRVRACGGDVALVAEGAALGLPGSGEAPGAEQWVATACGVARWAAGVQRFQGSANDCALHVSLGAAQLYVAEDVAVEAAPDSAGAAADAGLAAAHGARSPWRRVDAKQTLRLRGRNPLGAAPSVSSALTACERAARSVQSLARGMANHEAGADASNVGELAAESVVARGVARAACAVAGVRVALAGAGAGRGADASGARARLEAASALYRR